VSGRTAPPSGWPAPDVATLAGERVDLVALAEAVADAYFERFPEDLDRYGDAARAWELHDTRHLVSWAVGDVEGLVDLERQVAWLARVLAGRDFPLEHLAVNLELAAGVVDARIAGGDAVAGRLHDAAALVRRT
jgi:hypothetical protein